MKGSDNPYPSLLFEEHVDPAAPASGYQRLFIDTDHHLKSIDSSSTVTDWSTAGGGIPATILDAKGDLIAASAADTAARLAVGTDGYILSAASGETTGLKWIPHTVTEAHVTTDVSLTASYGDVVSITAASGTWIVMATIVVQITANSPQNLNWGVFNGANTQLTKSLAYLATNNGYYTATGIWSVTSDGTLKIRAAGDNTGIAAKGTTALTYPGTTLIGWRIA